LSTPQQFASEQPEPNRDVLGGDINMDLSILAHILQESPISRVRIIRGGGTIDETFVAITKTSHGNKLELQACMELQV